MLKPIILHIINNVFVNTLLKITAFLFILTIANSAIGSSEQPDKDDDYPIEIKSNTADFDDKTGDATHRGNVVVVQGTRHLTGDTLVIHRNSSGNIDRMVAYGTPVRFHAYPEPQKPLLEGRANVMQYYPNESKIILLDDAELTQNQDRVQGPIITYYLNNKVLSSESNSAQRTTVIFHSKD